MGQVQKEHSLELYNANSTLTCRGVRRVSWHFSTDSGKEPWLDYVWMDKAYRNERLFSFFLRGHEWHCRRVFEEDEWSVVLEDGETPYLWSTRNER